MNDDVLIGLRFEVSGGLGRMSGRVVGRTGTLYLVQKDGAEHLELLELDDLRPAKFFRERVAAIAASVAALAEAPPAETSSAEPPRRKLADQIRKHLASES